MFQEMRRKRQQLTREECEAILRKMTFGTLALYGADGYPYAVPVSYVYAEGKIYFHSAVAGHKVDAMSACDKLSFCVVEQDCIVPAEYTTYYRSVIVFGRVRVVTDGAEKRRALEWLGRKYAPGDEAGLQQEIDKGFNRLLMYEISIDHLTGKEAIELAVGRHPSALPPDKEG